MAQLMLVNPRKRRRRKTTKRRATALSRVTRRSPVQRRRRRNPIGGKLSVKNVMKNTVMPSMTAAGGALALDVAWGSLPIPLGLKTGPLRHLVKGAGAIGMGMLAAMFTRPETAKLVATGAMTVVMHGAGRELIGRMAPNIPLGMYEESDPFTMDALDLEGMGYAGAGYTGVDEMGMGSCAEDMGLYETDMDGLELEDSS